MTEWVSDLRARPPGTTKLDERQVSEIKAECLRLRDEGILGPAAIDRILAAEFRVKPDAISRIRRGVTWSTVRAAGGEE